MEDQYNLTLDDLADRLGMHPRYLTNKKNGPVTRVLETYYWLELTDGNGYSEEIVKLLEDYLACCGKRGEGIDFVTWQKSTWELNDKEPGQAQPVASEALTYIQPSEIEIIGPDEAIASLSESVFAFNASTNSVFDRCDAIGEQFGNQIVTRITVATKKSVDSGLAQLMQNLSKMGDN